MGTNKKKRTEALVRSNADQMAQILDGLYQFIGLLDLDGTIRYLNRAPVEAAGLPEDELLGLKFWDSFWWRGGDHELLKSDIRRAAAGEVIQRETPVLTKHGPIVIEFNLYPIRDDDGRVVQMVAEGRNITERRKAELALRESERLLRQIIDLVPHFIFAKDRDGRFILINRAVADNYGTTVEELTGKKDADFARSEEEVEHFRADDLAVIDSGTPKFIPDEPITNAEGDIRSLTTVKIPFSFSGKKAVLGVSVDITERKRLWDEAQKVQRLEALGVLAGGLAHDFNNLLSGIFGFIELARKVSKDPRTANYLDEALHSMARARGLTRQILTFAKGGAPNCRTSFLQPLVLDTARFTLSGSLISFTADLSNDLPPCDHDPDQIGQVINNILLNAQQAMPAGGTVEMAGRVVLVAEEDIPSLAPGRYIALSLSDHGIGIPAEILPRIFDPFFTTKQKGSGLGLAVSHSIVRQHGGTITVRSEPGKGTTFTIYLPVSEKRMEPEVSPPAPADRTGSGRILLMDDEEMLLSLLSQMLERLGYATVCVRDGAVAVTAFTKAREAGTPFAAVMLDLTVPGGMGGKEAAARIRHLDTDTPIFVFSGYADDPVMSSPLRYGFNDSLAKPFSFEDLARLLSKHLMK
ncbi:MAG TPA: PAS domain-containing protein [bacterium]|nr:PAS domain-containing protein [bacterium]